MVVVAGLIDQVLDGGGDAEVCRDVNAQVLDLCGKFPLYAHGGE